MTKKQVFDYLERMNDWIYLRQASEYFGVATKLDRAKLSAYLRYLVKQGEADMRVVGLNQYRIKT